MSSFKCFTSNEAPANLLYTVDKLDEYVQKEKSKFRTLHCPRSESIY